MASASNLGNLFLIPTTLGNNRLDTILPPAIAELITKIDFYIVENEKTARRFIKAVVPEKQQSEITLFPLNKFTDLSMLPSFLEPCKSGNDTAVLSEAGCPGIADPGADIVKIAHREGIRAVPMVGPSSILLAMMASGMNGQNFAFNGYLPIEKHARKQEIKALERLSLEKNQAQIFIETPYRNNKVLEDLLRFLNPATSLCIGCDITLSTETIITKTVLKWKSTKIDLHKRPCIFILQKEF